MSASAVLAAIHEVIAEIRADPLVDVTERVEALLSLAVTASAHTAVEERQQLVQAFSTLETEVAASLERLADELRKAGTARTAMTGYGAIRPHTRSQRLRTRV